MEDATQSSRRIQPLPAVLGQLAMTDSNRFSEMEVFVAVVDAGSMSAAARIRHSSPSAISKIVSRLEDRLQVRLLLRSTRLLELTPEGKALYASAVQLLAGLNDAERVATRGTDPVGRVRVSTSSGFGLHILAPLVPEFLEQYPEVVLDLAFTDEVVDLVGARTDVAIRAGTLKNSSMVARKLGDCGFTVVAAPSYLARVGGMIDGSTLPRHTVLSLSYRQGSNVVGEDGVDDDGAAPNSRVEANDSEALRHLAIHGAGFARLPTFMVQADMAAGRLERVPQTDAPNTREPFYAVYLGSSNMPARTRAFLDFLCERVVLGD